MAMNHVLEALRDKKETDRFIKWLSQPIENPLAFTDRAYYIRLVVCLAVRLYEENQELREELNKLRGAEDEQDKPMSFEEISQESEMCSGVNDSLKGKKKKDK